MLVGETGFPCPLLMPWPHAGSQHLPFIPGLILQQALLGGLGSLSDA